MAGKLTNGQAYDVYLEPDRLHDGGTIIVHNILALVLTVDAAGVTASGTAVIEDGYGINGQPFPVSGSVSTGDSGQVFNLTGGTNFTASFNVDDNWTGIGQWSGYGGGASGVEQNCSVLVGIDD